MPSLLLDQRYQKLEQFGVYPLLHDGNRIWSNKELLAAGEQVAGLLRAQGIDTDYHLVALVDDATLLVAYLAAEHLGIPFIPLDPQLSADVVTPILQYCHPCVVLGAPQWNAALFVSLPQLFSLSLGGASISEPELHCWASQGMTGPAVQVGADHDRPNVVIFTSGTTREAKGVALSSASILANHQQIIRALSYTPEDRLLTPLPLTHIYGLCLVNIAWLAGARLILKRPFRPKSMVEAIALYQATCFDSIPRMYLDLVRYADRAREHIRSATASIRMWNCGGSNLSERVARDFVERLGQPILNSYGLTEAPWVSYSTPSHHRYGSVGRIVPGVEVRIVDELEQPLPMCAAGEIWVGGDPVMQGYYGAPEMTARMLREGFLYTGDAGYMDEDGFLYIQARCEAQVNISGFKVILSEIEEIIATHPDVMEVAVIARAHATHDHDLVAFVVPQIPDTLNDQMLQRFCKERLVNYMVPHHFIVTDELPYTTVGKINRQILKQGAMHLL